MTDKIDNIENSPKEELPKSGKKSIWKQTICIISAVIILPIFLLIGILATNYGQRAAIQLVDKFIDNITIDRVSGGLQEGLVLNNIQFQSAGIDNLIEQATLKLDLSCLLKAKICLQDLSIENPNINIDTALLPPKTPENQTPTEIHKINLPIDIEANNILVKNLQVIIDNNLINLNTFHSSFSLNNDTGLTLAPTSIDTLFIRSDHTVTLKQDTKKDQKKPINWHQLEQQLTPAILGNIKEIELPFDIHVKNIQGTNWKYQQIDENISQDILVPNIQLQLDATGYNVKLPQLIVESSLGTMKGQGKLLLKDDFPINISINTDINEFYKDKQRLLPQTDVSLAITGHLKKQTQIYLTTKGIAETLLSGEFSLNEPKTPLKLSLVSEYLQYPIDENSIDPLNIENINLDITGNLLNYQATLLGHLSGMGIPDTKINTTINGTLTSLNIEALTLNTLKGLATLKGYLNWKNNIEWQSTLDVAKINFSSYLKEFPAILSGNLVSNGKIEDDKWIANIHNIDIKGSLSHRPISLKGNVNLTPKKLLDIPELLLNYGNNTIAVKGYLNNESDLDLDINAPNLSGLLPDLTATLFGNAKVSGKVSNPNIKVDLKGNNIKYQGLNIAKLDVNADITSEQLIKGDVNIDVKNFTYNDIKVNLLKLTAIGDEKNHKIQINSQGDPVAINLNLLGNFDRTSQSWKGILSQINMDSPIGKWLTNKNINIEYDNTNQSASINAHCWQNTNIDLCFPENFKVGKEGKIPFDIKKINLNIINEYIKNDTLTGILQSQGTVTWFTDKPLNLTLQINGNNLSVKHKIDYRTFNLDIPKLQLNADLKDNNLDINSNMRIQDQGDILTNLIIKDLTNEKNLSGSLKITGVNLNLVNQILSNKEKIDGDLLANLTFAGSLNKPLLNGSFNIENINAKVRSMPFDISNGKLNLSFQGNKSVLNGNIQTPDSQLNVEGNASWNSLDDWKTELAVKGDKFNVRIPSIAKLKISPDVKVTANPQVIELSGIIDVPWARIEIESLPDSAVPISEDEVILDGPNKSKEIKIGRAPIAAKTKSGIEIRSNLKINIGDDVSLSAYGLNSELYGLLSVQQNQGNLGLYGQINLKNGRYSSFGQDLIIKKGQISFSGEPSQPMLNIKAIRNPSAMENKNVTAGVNIVGIADSPQVTVFSEPSSSQAEALSYLLTGRSLENSGAAGSGSSIGAALIGLSLSSSGKLIGGIGEAFGIQDLNLGTSGVGDSSKIEVSGYITPRLQAKYGIGLFDGLAEFTLRYKLLPQLYLQSVSGVSQAVDLLYEFNF